MGRTSTLNNINYYRNQINYLHDDMNELRRKIQVLHEMLAEHQRKAGIYRTRVETEATNLNHIRNFQYIKSAQSYNEDMNNVLNGHLAGAAIADLEVIKNSICRRIEELEEEYSRMQRQVLQLDQRISSLYGELRRLGER